MDKEERDQLLARLDERTHNIWRVTEKQEGNIRELNGHVRENTSRSVSNKVWIRIITSVGGAALLFVLTCLIGIIKLG